MKRLFVRSALLQVLVNSVKAKHQYQLPTTNAHLLNNPGLFKEYKGVESYRKLNGSNFLYFESPQSGLRVLSNRIDASLKKRHSLHEFLCLHYNKGVIKEYEISIVKYVYWSTNHRIDPKNPLTDYILDY